MIETKQHLKKHKPPLSRGLRDCRLAGNNERRVRPSKASSLTLEGDMKPLFSVETDVFFALPFALTICFFSGSSFVCVSCVCLQISKAGTRGEWNFHSRMGAVGMRTRCVNCCTRTGARIVISICVNERYNMYHVAPCPPHNKYCCLPILIAFRLRRQVNW